MSVQSALSARHYTINSRVHSTKNSRALGNGRSFLNAKARAWLEAARQELRTQHKGKPLEGCYCVQLVIYYADGRWNLDVDNAASGVLDSLKGIVVVDDSPTYISKLEVESRRSRQGKSYVDITLKEMK